MHSRDLLLLVPFTLLLVYIHARRTRRRLPPGPPGWPIVGNTFLVPQRSPWLEYAAMSRRYGSDIICLELLGTSLVVLNSAKAAVALLDKRSSIYSDRPVTTMMQMTGANKLVGLMGYGDLWRACRRAFHQHFNERAIGKYEGRVQHYTRMLVRSLLDAPDDFLDHASWMAGAIILNVTYGFDIKDTHDPILKSVEASLLVTNSIYHAGSFLVDSLPWLKFLPSWFPGVKFKRLASKWKVDVSTMFDAPFDTFKSEGERGITTPSVASALLSTLEKQEDKDSYEYVIKCATGTAFSAGHDTTSATIQTFFLAMVQYPEVQNLAQGEIDRVIGAARLPDLDDEAQLPFVTAVLYEVLRWRPVVPLGLSHRSIQDDEYDGYHIPGGSIVVSNIWAILHDKNTYPDPESFDPHRFLNPDGSLNTRVPRPDATFGFGRRICLGRHFAMRSLWMALANILAVFRVEKAVDEDGRVVEPSGEFEGNFIISPAPFKAIIRPRSAAAAELARSSIVEGDPA